MEIITSQSEGWMSELKGLAGWVSPEALVLGVQPASVSCTHVVLLCRFVSWYLLMRAPVIWGEVSLMTSCYLDPLTALSGTCWVLQVRTATHRFGV